MPIIIPREGVIPPPAAPPLTQEQKDKIWEAIIKNWAQAHPEAIKNLVEVTP